MFRGVKHLAALSWLDTPDTLYARQGERFEKCEIVR